MFSRIFAKYEQAIVVGGCSLISFVTMGWMIEDIQRQENKRIIINYEKKILTLTEENKGLKGLIEAQRIQF
jgi:hypothetical protein